MRQSQGSANPQEPSPAEGAGSCRFRDFELDLPRAELRLRGERLLIPALSLALLEFLIRHRARVVTADELMAHVWRGVKVTQGSIRQAISELRQTLGDSAEAPRLIHTVRGRGYRFVAPLSGDAAAEAGSQALAMPVNTVDTHDLELAAPLHEERLVGREAELARLRAAFAEAHDVHGRLCVVTGAPGVGKTRLVRELLTDVAASQQGVVEGFCDPDRAAPPFWPWYQILTAFSAANPQHRTRLDNMAPAFQRALDRGAMQAVPVAADRAGERYTLLHEMAQMLVASACSAPGAIVLEDVQWADEASLDFLKYVAPWLARTHSLLIVTCRAYGPQDERALARVMKSLLRTAGSEAIELANLTEEAIASMHAVQGREPLSPAIAQQIFEISRGNALFARELSRLVSGFGEGPNPSEVLPREVQGAVVRRLSALPEEALRTVTAASVLGATFSVAELSAVLEVSAAECLSRLDVCAYHDVLVEQRGERHAFTHALMREGAYSLLSREQRCGLHARAGEWLEQHVEVRQTTRQSELARHFVAAAVKHDPRKAIRCALKCAEHAQASTADVEALRYYDQALACADFDPTMRPQEIMAIQLLRGDAMRGAGVDTLTVNRHFLEIVEQAEALHESELFARAVVGYTGQRRLRFCPTRSPASPQADQVALIERALASNGDAPTEVHALLLCSLACTLLCSTDRARREEAAQRAVGIATTLGTAWLVARALATQLYCCDAPENGPATLRRADDLVSWSRTHGLVNQECDALMTRAILCLRSGNGLQAEQDANRARLLATQSTAPQLQVRTGLVDLMNAFMRGDLATARSLTQRAFEAAVGDTIETTFYAMRTATLDMMQYGLREQTLELHQTMLAEYPDALGIHCAVASIHATRGEFDRARYHFDLVANDDFAGLPEDMNWLGAMTLLADTAKWLNDPERGLKVYRRLLPFANVFDFYVGESTPGGPVAYWLAELAALLGVDEKVAQWLDIADKLNANLGATLFAQFSSLARARLIARVEPERAAEVHERLRNASVFATCRRLHLLQSAAQHASEEVRVALAAQPSEAVRRARTWDPTSWSD